MTEPKKNPTATGAKKGKVKGSAEVTPKAPSPEAEDIQGSPVAPPPTTDEYPDAFQAGYKASQHGTPSRPPLEYSNAEVKAWYRGYKAHANPQTGGPVDGIEGGYRGVY